MASNDLAKCNTMIFYGMSLYDTIIREDNMFSGNSVYYLEYLRKVSCHKTNFPVNINYFYLIVPY